MDYYKCIQPFDKLHKDLKRQAKKSGALIVYADPNKMVLYNEFWKQLNNVELLLEINKKTPIMESHDTVKRFGWRIKKL